MSRFCFEATKYLFFEHQNAAFLDGYCYIMDVPLEPSDAGEILAGALDLCRIFSPELQCCGGFLQSMHGKTALVHGDDGIPRVCLREVLQGLLCLKLTQYSDIWAASQELWQPDYELLLSCRTMCRGKTWGELRLLRWEKEIARLLPYVLYLPTQMRSPGKRPLLIVFHGAGGSTEDVFFFSSHHISELAEEKNFIVLAVSACYTDSAYGCQIPPCGVDSMDAKLFASSPEKAKRLEQTERTVTKVVEETLRAYPIDPKRIYLAGNSMGGMAAFYYAAKYPDRIRAIAPAGAVPAPNAFPTEKIRGVPVFFTAGTEDFHGYDYLRCGCKHLKQADVPLTFYTVGGGDHGRAWIQSMNLWVDFLLDA